jgi:hypothetical protein
MVEKYGGEVWWRSMVEKYGGMILINLVIVCRPLG